jgi:hypothetical protein
MIDRAQTRDQLTAWMKGQRKAQEVWLWAEQAKHDRETFEDPLVQDVIDTLATLPQDLITVEDAEIMLYGLNNPIEEADLAQNLLWNHLDNIDTEARRRALAEDEFYAPFCGAVT